MMLEEWQGKFPNSFEQYPGLCEKLSANEKEKLSNLLDEIESIDAALLDENIINFILAMASKDFKFIEFFMSEKIDRKGFCRAFTLMQLSNPSLFYSQFALLSKVLANPLSQTIFDARLRSFSDYSEPSKLSVEKANEIIQELNKLSNEEDRIGYFFDFFSTYRPYPPSQSYLNEINILDIINAKLNSYFESTIESIRKKKNMAQVREIMTILKSSEKYLLIFDKIKYEIGSDIESTDMCSQRNYRQLMQEIWEEFNNVPGGYFEKWREQFELEGDKISKAFISAARKEHSFLRPLVEKQSDTSTSDESPSLTSPNFLGKQGLR